MLYLIITFYTAQKMKKSLMNNFIFCIVLGNGRISLMMVLEIKRKQGRNLYYKIKLRWGGGGGGVNRDQFHEIDIQISESKPFEEFSLF